MKNKLTAAIAALALTFGIGAVTAGVAEARPWLCHAGVSGRTAWAHCQGSGPFAIVAECYNPLTNRYVVLSDTARAPFEVALATCPSGSYVTWKTVVT